VVACKTIADKRNGNCDRVVIGEWVLPLLREEEAHDEDEFEDVNEKDERDEEGKMPNYLVVLQVIHHHLHLPNPNLHRTLTWVVFFHTLYAF